MAFTEFYIQQFGSNLNGGSSNSNNATFTCINGNWNTANANFKPRDGQNPSGNVNVGDFASIYPDGSSVGVYITRITFVQNAVNGNITTSTTSVAGTAPTNGASNRTIKVAGAWQGPTNA
jgi:hypothetical protein